MKRIAFSFYIIIAITFSVQKVLSQTPSLNIRNVTTGLDTPWEILWGPDSMIWMTERSGKVTRVDPVSGQQTLIGTISNVVEISESGLMGMVLHPDFKDTPYVYLAYNYLAGPDIKLRIERYTYQSNTLTNPYTLIENITGNGNHNGCRLYIGPDRKLLVTTGDAQNTSLAQNFNSLSGKLLRMNLDGSIPSDNPWPGKYFYSTGHRNAQGLVISPDGKIYISEHGPSNDDELNLVYPKRNYGWPNVEGYCNLFAEMLFCNDSNVVEPMVAWTPTLAVCGLDFYSHSHIPQWDNSLLMVTLKADRLVQMKLNATGDTIIEQNHFYQNNFGRLRDLCVSPEGRVYLATSNRDGRANDGFPKADDDKIIELSNFGVGIKAVNKPEIKVFPNPTSGGFRVYFSNSEDWHLSCFKINGQLMTDFELKQQSMINIETADWAPGLYLLKVSAGGYSFYKKIVVSH